MGAGQKVLDDRTRHQKIEVPWPGVQMVGWGSVYSLADVIDTMEGRIDEPKNSSRRVAIALEVEIALKLSSARGGVRIELPLTDRSLGLTYEKYR